MATWGLRGFNLHLQLPSSIKLHRVPKGVNLSA
jgi:hypothetical protein